MNLTGLYSAEAEKAALGCMLAQPEEVMEEAERLVPQDFFVPAHREMFTALTSLRRDSQPIDVQTVHQWLSDRKLAEQVGSPGILGELLTAFATHLNVGTYIRTILDKSLLRRLRAASVDIAKDIDEMPDSVPDVLDRAEKAIAAVTNSLSKGSLWSAEACVSDFEAWRVEIQAGTTETFIRTGLRPLDDANGGLPIPSYVVIAGQQGVGKSALILNIMENACMAGIPVGGFSMEMTMRQIVARQVAKIADIDSRRLRGKLHAQEEEAVTQAYEVIRRMPYYLEPRSGLTPNDIRVMTRQMVRKGCKIVWLDNAQLMQGSTSKDKRAEQLTEVSRTIQHLQKEHNIVFILLCQVNREGQKRGSVQLFDLADCAAFERDARVVLMLEPKPTEQPPPSHSVPIICRIAKFSEGETGGYELTFNKQKQRIT